MSLAGVTSKAGFFAPLVIGAILILDYFVIRRRNPDQAPAEGIQWAAVAAWAAGFAAAKLLPGIPPLNTLVAASIVYLLLARRIQAPQAA